MKRKTATCSGRAATAITRRLNRTPSVFGRISVYCTINSVNTSENTPMYWLPKVAARLPPATAAPMVWAAVLMIRITAIGLSISRFSD